MAEGGAPQPIVREALRFLEGFGQVLARAFVASIEHGPEVLIGLAEMQVDAEHTALLQAEWSHHPLLDFIIWQETPVAQIMALTMPEKAVAGHAALARLLQPICTKDEVLADLEQVARVPDLSGFASEEFRHGLDHVRVGELSRALTPLTIGLEGLIRSSSVSLGVLTTPEVDELESGSQLVKRLWPLGSAYRPYMKSWVFGMADVYRHGSDTGAAAAQALHAICGAAIWADQIMGQRSIFEIIQSGLTEEVTRAFARGELQLEPAAEKRLLRAAERAGKNETVKQLLEIRDQLLEMRQLRTVHVLAARAMGADNPRTVVRGPVSESSS